MISKNLFKPTYVYSKVSREGISAGTQGELGDFRKDIFGEEEYCVYFSTYTVEGREE